MSERAPDADPVAGEGEQLGRPAARPRRGKLDEAARRDIVARYTAGEKVAASAHRYQVGPGAIYHHLNHRIVLRRDPGPDTRHSRRLPVAPPPRPEPVPALRGRPRRVRTPLRPPTGEGMTRRPDCTATRGRASNP